VVYSFSADFPAIVRGTAGAFNPFVGDVRSFVRSLRKLLHSLEFAMQIDLSGRLAPLRRDPMRYRFGPFDVDTASREVRKGGVPLKLGDQPFQVLGALLEHAGEDVPREELQRRIWSEGTFVDFDKGLNSAVNKLREALADSADRPRYIETIPRRGYRFIARLETEVEPVASQQPAAAVISSRLWGPEKWRRTAIAAAVAILTLTGATVLVWSRRDPAPITIRSLLILPFQSANSPDSDYLGQGISEQLTASLAALPGLRLLSPAAAYRLGSAGVSPQEAGQRLDVDAVLFGSVRRAEHKIRVNVQMIRSTDGQVLWAEGGLNAEGKDLIETERLVATAIAARLRRSLGASEKDAIALRQTRSPDAYELYVRGRFALRKSREDPQESRIAEKLFDQAVKLDSGFAEALAWRALAQYAQFTSGIAGDNALKSALENARRALKMDPTVTAARRALITIFHSTGQAEEGLREAAILRQSGTVDVDSLTAMALAYLRGGMPDRAVTLYQRALDLDPENDQLNGSLSYAAVYARQYELGLDILKTSSYRHSFSAMLNAQGAGRYEIARSAALEIMREVESAFTFAMCWQTLRELGGMEEAHQIWRTRNAEFEDSAKRRNERVRIGLAIVYATLNERRKALEKLRLALEANPGDPWALFYAAEGYGLLGEEQKALESLQQSINRGFLSLAYLDRQFEHSPRGLYRYRNDPQFRALRDRLAAKIERLRRQY
jgi:DNA-binding winged helix-turn-helix (wHTH) protein/TolB-like protein